MSTTNLTNRAFLLLFTLTAAASASAATTNVFQGDIIRHPGLGGTTGSSVDHWFFTVNDNLNDDDYPVEPQLLPQVDPGFYVDPTFPTYGPNWQNECCENDYPSTQRVTIDTLSWEHDSADSDGDGNYGEFIDVNHDGETAYVDTYTYLFRNDGFLDSSDLITSNDDSDSTFGDGSIYRYDSYLEADLEPGQYILAIGSFFLSLDDAIDRFNDGNRYPFDANGPSNHGDYQVTFSENVSVTGSLTGITTIPEPGSAILVLLGGTLIGAISMRTRLG